MKVEKYVCDLCGDEAESRIRFSPLRVTRGAPKKEDVMELCAACSRELALYLDSVKRQVGQ